MTIAKWNVDIAHSNVDFSVRHMMVSKVKGSFNDFTAEVEADPNDLTTASLTFTINMASIDTRNDDRDNHLRSADFFEVEKYPELTFTSTEIKRKSEDTYAVTGNVSMHGVTQPETFNVTFEGVAKDPMSGAEKAGFSVEGTLKRSEYNLTWNASLETGGVLVSDDVKIHLEIQAAKEA
ncbi:YceI family protein [Lederbergia lenta]|uniref:YceI family protein n=1 Tax=Lederbergia lenta TaxID=1467 RepID=A0A2X4VQC3_LEDLE|nr:YceI family protein [Lederbergia lenta]MCM3112342.1 YceI family protein [Lederbergia lenta]MEC2326562.1 YceI family protein [Lederbergia lenta]SQI53173.1 YceI family protein [Lederbergia lenta]